MKEHLKQVSNKLGVDYLPPEDLVHQICIRAGPEKAVDCFKLNTSNYPGSYGAFNDLAEAYLAKGETGLAIENFKKSLALSPRNQKAVEGIGKTNAPFW